MSRKYPELIFVYNAYKKIFLHRDDFMELFPKYASTPLPVIFTKELDALTVLVCASEINQLKNWQELKALLISKLHYDCS